MFYKEIYVNFNNPWTTSIQINDSLGLVFTYPVYRHRIRENMVIINGNDQSRNWKVGLYGTLLKSFNENSLLDNHMVDGIDNLVYLQAYITLSDDVSLVKRVLSSKLKSPGFKSWLGKLGSPVTIIILGARPGWNLALN